MILLEKARNSIALAQISSERDGPTKFVAGCDFEEFSRYWKRSRYGEDFDNLTNRVIRGPSQLMYGENNEIIGHAVRHETNTEGHKKGERRDIEDRKALEKLLGGKKDFVELHGIWLMKEHRGRGFGKRFFEFFEELIGNEGYDSIPYYADHPAAVAICRQRGYEEEYLMGEAEYVFYLSLKRNLKR